MDMQSKIRYVEGKVEVNFFSEGRTEDVIVENTSRSEDYMLGNNKRDPELERRYKQIFVPSLDFSKKYFILPEKNEEKYAHNGRLDKDFCLAGSDSKIGWYGDEMCNANGDFSKPQTITLFYPNERELNYLLVGGWRGEYPAEFRLQFMDKHGRNVAHANEQRTLLPKEDWDGRTVYKITFDALKVNKVMLAVTKWSEPYTVAKITCFTSERKETFGGKKLQYLEILEEKAPAVDKLSYGITSNYCKLGLLNENDRFFEKADYTLLGKNREIMPFIKCGEGGYRSLGKFFSDEWKVPADSRFITCKAYDILYSLKDVTVNYGLKTTAEGYELYSEEKLVDVIKKLENLINDARMDSGIFGSNVQIEARLGDLADWKLPYTLIEKKTAWDILQDIAELCCAYVYVDRNGKVIIERDIFNSYHLLAKEPDTRIDMTNAFTYSLPVSSKNVVNQVDIEYYDLVEEKKENDTDDNTYKIKYEDLRIEGSTAYFTIQLKKIHKVILDMETELPEIKLELIEKNFDALTCRINNFSAKNFKDEQVFTLKNSGNWKLEKRTCTLSDSISIRANGLKPYTCKASTLMSKDYAKHNAQKILAKYKDGVSYLESAWKGDDALKLGDAFLGDTDASDGKRKTYECLSNEIVLDNGFRQTTKGIAVKE